MPISREKAALYPKNWHEIRREILEREQNLCKFCQVPNHWIVWRDTSGRWHSTPRRDRQNKYFYDCNDYRHKNIKIVLTIAHLNHYPRDNRPENLAALCQQCHNRIDIADRVANRRRRVFEAAGGAYFFIQPNI